MLQAVKNIFNLKPGNALTKHYSSRALTAKNRIEAEAILYMNSLLSLYDRDSQTNAELGMKIEHVAIWCKKLETMKYFYEHYFDAKSNEKYENPAKGFSSYFLTLPDGPRIELMNMDSVLMLPVNVYSQFIGMAHLAFSVGSEDKVNQITEKFISDGYEVLDGPRWTGDGYYESLILDPEGNRLEITV
ncbi:VOC family protein [Psychromonas ossibalaenae]|uniref:VOC family protein n=1 Tax=Psychromonas ossibalaenae TaxID=444922 RepID=UPI00037A29BB|nr:VOC family protein [Psychromonas ossibalaenae]